MPVKEILLVHHSHTDLGYTNHQDSVLALQREYLRRAMDLAERYEGGAPGERFRWTCETTLLARDFLDHCPPSEAERLVGLHRRGLIDFGGMFANVTPLYSAPLLADSLGVAAELRRDYGLDIRHALNCDVNGQAWGLVELLLDSGYEGLGMAINRVMARDPQPRPRGFRWRGPSGRSILAWHGEHYGHGHYWGIPRNMIGGRWTYDLAESRSRVALYLERLGAAGYPHDFAMLQITSTFMWDNGGPHEELLRFVREWNARGWEPRLRLASLAEHFEALGRQEGLETLGGDWTDWWSHGVASSAYETALVRAAQSRLASARLLGSLMSCGSEAFEASAGDDAAAWRALALYSEHTWGGFDSVSHPLSLNARGQWHRKASFAYEGAAAATRLSQAASRELASRLPQSSPGTEASGLSACVFNPLPWARSLHLLLPRATATGWEAAQLERDLELACPDGPSPAIVDYGVVELPACGYAILPMDLEPSPVTPRSMMETAESAFAARSPDFVPRLRRGRAPATTVRARGWEIENELYSLRLDPASGAIASLVEKAGGREWVDRSTPWRLGHYVHETNASPRGRDDMQLDFASGPDRDRQADLAPSRRGPRSVIEAGRYEGEGNGRLCLRLDAPGAAELRAQVVLYDELPWIDLVFDIDKLPISEPESVYFAFPFALAGATARYEAAGAIVEAEAEQLPYACRDFYAVQNWVDLSGPERGITLATPDAPILHLGGFTNHRYLGALATEQPLMASWPMNNHWMTNFRPSQSGWTRFRYRLLPHGGPFDPVASARLGAEAAAEPILGPLWDRPAGLEGRAKASAPDLPASGSLLSLEPGNVRLLGLKPVAGGLLALLQEIGGRDASALLRFPLRASSAALRAPDGGPLRGAEAADAGAFGGAGVDAEGAARVELRARGMASILVSFA